MLRIGVWIEHPHFGVGRIANHHGTRYICSFPGVGLREVESHEAGIREVDPPQEDPIKSAVREVLEEYFQVQSVTWRRRRAQSGYQRG